MDKNGIEPNCATLPVAKTLWAAPHQAQQGASNPASGAGDSLTKYLEGMGVGGVLALQGMVVVRAEGSGIGLFGSLDPWLARSI